MEKVFSVPVHTANLNGLMKKLSNASFRVQNVGCDRQRTYVYLAQDEEKDPTPIMEDWVGIRRPQGIIHRTVAGLRQLLTRPKKARAKTKPPATERKEPAEPKRPAKVAIPNLALVGWGGDSGVGRELIDASRHLPVDSIFILKNLHKPTRKDLLSCPNQLLSKGEEKDLVEEMKEFIHLYRPKVILTWEVPGCWEFPKLWKQHGIRWVHVVHWDWFASQKVEIWRMANLVAPNVFCQNQLKACNLDAELLPVPIDTDKFEFKLREKGERFVSLYGHGGKANRRSLPEIFAAWRGMSRPPKLTIHAQRDPEEIQAGDVPPGVGVRVGNLPEPEDVWRNADVAVQVSRYEGVGVSFLEAQACGVPVIALDYPPMNEIAPDLKVSVERKGSVITMGRTFECGVPSSKHLRKVVKSLHGRDIRELSEYARERVEKEFSWSALQDRWLAILSGRR